jgi:two-component system, sensor histidine kinase and response regulator
MTTRAQKGSRATATRPWATAALIANAAAGIMIAWVSSFALLEKMRPELEDELEKRGAALCAAVAADIQFAVSVEDGAAAENALARLAGEPSTSLVSGDVTLNGRRLAAVPKSSSNAEEKQTADDRRRQSRKVGCPVPLLGNASGNARLQLILSTATIDETLNRTSSVLRPIAGVVLLMVFGQLMVALFVTRRLQRAHRELRDALSAKNEFLGSVSHEIRTPMNGILGITDLMLSTPLSPELRDSLEIVRTSADSLLTVINDILDYSKLEAAKVALSPVEFEVRDHLVDGVRSFAIEARKKDIELVCHVHRDVPEILVGDPVRLRQIILNLAGNAVKFTARGDVIVRAEVEKASPEGIWIHFSVSDTGIGIPRDKLELIFEPFTQADGSTTRKFGGTGLGLSITKKLVDLLDGQVWVESEVGRGSVFHVRARFGQTTSSQSAPSPGPRVLIADHHRPTCEAIAELFYKVGSRPTICCEPRGVGEAIARAFEEGAPFDIALIDLADPELGAAGAELKSTWRPSGPTRLVALVHVIDYCEGRGATPPISAALRKPVKESDVRALLEPSNERSSALAEPPAPPTRAAQAETQLDVLVVEDNLVNQVVTKRMLESNGHRVTVADNGKKALTALDGHAFDIILMDMHMPEMDGLETTREIRRREAKIQQRTPILALTAGATQEDREQCIEAGMDAVVTKPVKKKQLLGAIASLYVHGSTAAVHDLPSRVAQRAHEFIGATTPPISSSR